MLERKTEKLGFLTAIELKEGFWWRRSIFCIFVYISNIYSGSAVSSINKRYLEADVYFEIS